MVTKHKTKWESNPFKVVFNKFVDVFKLNTATAIFFIASTAVFFMLYLILIVVVSIVSETSTTSSGEITVESSGETSAAAIVGTVLFILFAVLAYIFLAGMANHAASTTAKGKKTKFSETINAVISKYGRLILISIIYLGIYYFYLAAAVLGTYAVGETVSYWLGALVGILFAIILIRFAMRYVYVFYPVFANDMGAIESFKHTKKITKGHLIDIAAQQLINNVVGQFSINLIFAPIYMSTVATMYPQMEADAKTKQKNRSHWASWLIVVIIGFFVAAYFAFLALIIISSENDRKNREKDLDNRTGNSLYDNIYDDDYQFDSDFKFDYRYDSDF